jgi:diguanylate cyclase (GGDEF)-like protein
LQPRRFNRDETYFLQAVANVLSMVIARHQTEEALLQAQDDAVLHMKSQVAVLRTENQQLSTELQRLKRVEQQLAHAVMHDPLTGLPNRALFRDRLEHALERAKRRDEAPFAVLFLDLDSFKAINDCFGHLVADQLLVKIARRLEVCLRPGDTVARFAGDEFTLLLLGLDDVRRASVVADRICRRLAGPIYIDEHEIRLTASIGIALSGTEYARPDVMLHAADMAMYQAMAKGKACFVVFDPALHVPSELVRAEAHLHHEKRR